VSTAAAVAPRTGLAAAWAAFAAPHPLWARLALAHLVLLAVLLPLAAVDPRLFQGVTVWIKPAKFALSIAVYLGTLVVFARLVPADWWRTFPGRATTAVAVVTSVFEMGYITLMAGLGEASHFNVSTPLTGALYSLMGAGAVALVTVALVLAIRIGRARGLDDPFVLAVVLGLGLSFALGGGFGGYLGSRPGHWVDAAPTDAGGLAGFGWARDGGDLRVAHFFGLHAMQVLPLLGLALRGVAGARAWVLLAAALYAAGTTFTFVQAVSGEAFLPGL